MYVRYVIRWNRPMFFPNYWVANASWDTAVLNSNNTHARF